ncbi:MAG: shikimate kinase [Bacteroidetes bacterium]|nr:shikimate kinase [Bacteroidota bacterium]
MKNIYLIGFMGSGKTTFGKKLARQIKMGFSDLDEIISHQFGKQHVSELINEQGFDFFRKAEQKCLRNAPGTQVIATGGGTPCYFDNMDWMKSQGIVVFLHPGIEVIFSRLKTTEISTRPLLKGLNEPDLKKYIQTTFEERLPFYQQAQLVFDPVRQKMDELVQAIQERN